MLEMNSPGLDFLESSGWPVRSIDFEINLFQLANHHPPYRFLRYAVEGIAPS